jgi:hypothetical protein
MRYDSHIGISYYFLKKALNEIKRTGDYSGLTKGDWVETRQEIENLCDLEDHYSVEEDTVEKKKWGKR